MTNQQIYLTMRTPQGRRAFAEYCIIKELKSQGVRINCVPRNHIIRAYRNLGKMWSGKL